MARTFVIGDIHGAFHALKQCLERSGFDYAHDTLICLGDVSDGWPQTKECIDELMSLHHLVYLLGNHDQWTLKWMENGYAERIWLSQGGEATRRSYATGVPEDHILFLKNAELFYVENNKLFVHAGILPGSRPEECEIEVLLWDRTLAQLALESYQLGSVKNLTEFDEVFIGHTPIPYDRPIKCSEVWMMDTGAGWSGVLSMLNIETKEIFVSDKVPSLYPGISARERNR